MIKLIVSGNLGKDPEKRTYGGDKVMTRFTVAGNYRLGGENKTEWVNVAAFGKLGEIAAKFLHKGSKVLVTGRPSARGYKNNLEEIVGSLDVVAEEVEFLDSKASAESAPAAQEPAPELAFQQTAAGQDLPF